MVTQTLEFSSPSVVQRVDAMNRHNPAVISEREAFERLMNKIASSRQALVSHGFSFAPIFSEIKGENSLLSSLRLSPEMHLRSYLYSEVFAQTTRPCFIESFASQYPHTLQRESLDLDCLFRFGPLHDKKNGRVFLYEFRKSALSKGDLDFLTEKVKADYATLSWRLSPYNNDPSSVALNYLDALAVLCVKLCGEVTELHNPGRTYRPLRRTVTRLDPSALDFNNNPIPDVLELDNQKLLRPVNASFSSFSLGDSVTYMWLHERDPLRCSQGWYDSVVLEHRQ